MNPAEMLFDIGDEVFGWGAIVQDADGAWFDPPVPIPLGFGGPRARSGLAVRLIGHDPLMVATDFSADGAIPGMATVQGLWWGDHIRVNWMTPVQIPDRREIPPRRTDPPCPPPQGGWPPGTVADLQGHDERSDTSDHVVDKRIYRPRPDSVVLVVTTNDVDAVDNELRPVLGDRLCIVRSRWGAEDLRAVRVYVREHWREWGVYYIGPDTDDNGQRTLTVDFVRMLPEMAEWMAGLPPGILNLEPALSPVALLPPEGRRSACPEG